MKSDETGVDEDNRFLRLGGHVDIYYEKQDRSAEEPMILDSWGLEIKQVRVSYDGSESFSVIKYVDHNLNQVNASARLELNVDSNEDEGILRIEYSATNSTSLRYSALEYTPFSEDGPVLAVLNRPGMARTWLPCQDTLRVKTPVEMKISVPHPYTALTSGIDVSKRTESLSDDFHYESFQPMPVAAEQLTLIVGRFERWEVSERISVWTETNRREQIRGGFLSEADSILKICESMVGPFVWEHLNIVVVPDKLGYKGEMLGPNTIYLPVSMFQSSSSPIEDDSLRVQELTRQMMYSWFGNLVTAPALRISRIEDPDRPSVHREVNIGERNMLRGIADYLSFHATAQFMDNDRHLADFFFKRSNEEEDVSSEKIADFSIVMRKLEDLVGGKETITKFLRIIVLFSVADDFSSEQFWNLLQTLFPDNEIDEQALSRPGLVLRNRNRYFDECSVVLLAWDPLPVEEEPVVKAGQLKELNYAQVAYMLESGVSDRLPIATVKKITSVLKKMGIYQDPNMFYRWALTAIKLGDRSIEDDARDYIETNMRNPGARALFSLLSERAEDGADRKKLKNIQKMFEEESYVPWN
ncbi:uncharacterized protein LOC134818408 [Bolinopsis microptera]|uniref:uncharacterized protein LOC134818408 n=1 Tax=Bolinopsis microptera TaxID=2820187 RepID=UPI003079CB94